MKTVLTGLAYLVERLSDVSTVNTLLAYLLAQIGVHLNPTFDTTAVQVIAGVFVLIGYLINDKAFTSARPKVKAMYAPRPDSSAK